jgi:hypothetical protein
MFATTDRQRTREVFFRAWQRYRRGEPLEGAERLVVAVALRHPEYHDLLDRPEPHRTRDYLAELGETNPFLHMGLHIALEEQLALDQPRGLRAHYERLLAAVRDEHSVQHAIMECLAEALWRAQRAGRAVPDEAAYLECVARLGRTP